MSFLEYSSRAPYPLVQPRIPAHHLNANGEFDYKVQIPEANKLFKQNRDIVKQTDLFFAPVLSAKLGNKIYLKREDTQKVFSFKIRGAFNAMNHLDSGYNGVATVSAGQYVYFYSLPPPDAFQATMHRALPSLAPNSKLNKSPLLSCP